MPEDKPSLHLVKFTDDPEKEVEFLQEPPRPSFPCPRLKVSTFEVTKISADEDGGILCDLKVEGVVTSPLCDIVPGEQGTIQNVSLIVNSDETAFGDFEVEVRKDQAEKTWSRRPFPFSGRFAFEAKGVGVIEGNNTFHIAAREPSTGMYGYSFWAVVFTAEYDESDDGTYRIRPDGLKSEAPTLLSQDVAPERYFYGFAVTDLRGFESSEPTLVVGNDDSLQLKLIPVSSHDGLWLATRPGEKRVPFQFFLTQPGVMSPGYVPLDEGIAGSLATNLKTKLSPRSQFVTAFCSGFFMGGSRIHGGGDHFTGNAADADVRLPFPKINAHLTAGGSPVADVDCYLAPTQFTGADYRDYGNQAIPDFLASLNELIQKDPEKATDVVIELISGGNFENLGLKGVEYGDWREDFVSVLAEITVEILQSEELESDAERGYYLGRAYGDAAKVALDFENGVRHDLGRGEFLVSLPGFTTFYRNESLGAKILEQNRDLIQQLSGRRLDVRVSQ